MMRVIDPFGGSYLLEELTQKLVSKARNHIEEIEELGGMALAIESGLPKHRIEEVATSTQARIESGEQTIVGLNKYCQHHIKIDDEQVEIRRIDNRKVRAEQIKRLGMIRQERDKAGVERALSALENAAATKENLVPFVIEAARKRATVGEISEALASQFGRHKAQITGVRGIWEGHMKGSAELNILRNLLSEFRKKTSRRPKFYSQSLVKMVTIVAKRLLPQLLPTSVLK